MQTKWIRPSSIELSNFGPFVGTHKLKLPESGLILVRGLVRETGGGSGAGKSYLVNAPAFVAGGCPFAATELQSWYTEETPGVTLNLLTPDGDVTATRHDGLALKGGLAGSKLIRTKTAEAKLDEIFGMDKELRALATHRGQDEPAVFFGMNDGKKKEVLTKLLKLDRFEKVATDAAVVAKQLEIVLASHRGHVAACLARVTEAQQRLADCVPADPLDIPRLEADVKGRQVIFQGLLDQAKGKLIAADSARATCAAEVERQLAVLKAEALAVRAEPRPDEIDELIATMAKIRSRLERVVAHDRTKVAEFEQGRTTLHLRLSQITGERRAQVLALQAQLVAERAALRELDVLATRQTVLRQQVGKLEDEICPTCEQNWCGAGTHAEIARLNAELATIDKALARRDTVRSTIADLQRRIAEPETDQESVQIAVELADYGDYVPHPMGAELRQAEKDTATAIDEAQQAWKVAQEAKLDALLRREQRVRTTGAALAEARSKDLMDAYHDLQARAEAEQRGISAVHFRIMEIKSALSMHAERINSLVTAQEALVKAQLTAEETAARINLELDVIAAVGKEGFLGLIFDDVLAEIAAATNDILKQVANVRHVSFEFNVEKEALNGNVTKAITPIVYSRGRKVSLSPGLSGGMGNAVKLAVDLGFGEVVAKRRGAYPGWLVLDESFNGLDRASKESCIEMLQVYAGDRLVLVVDHASEFQGAFSRIIEIEQTDGRSKIMS